MKKLLAVLTAGAILGAAMAGSALAAPAATTSTVTKNEAGSDGTMGANFTGTIKATILSATIPTTVAFDIDPTKEADDATKVGQLTQPSMAISNNSMVPIDVKINQVSVKVNGTAKDVLVDDGTAALTGQKTVFGIKTKAAVPANWSDSGVADADMKAWLTAASASAGYRVFPKSNALDIDKKVEISLYGKTGKGWKVNETISIEPVFVISAADTTYTALIGTAK